MRFLAPSPVFFTAGLVVWGCAVYDTELLPADAGLSGSGSTGADGGSGGKVSGGANGGTKPTSSSGAGSVEAGSSSGGKVATEGGAPSEEGGMGGEGPSGSGGSAGTGGEGGKAGSGGSSGSGGGGSAGSGGGGNTVKCSDHPLTAKTLWKVLASSSSLGNGMESDGLYNPPEHAIDGLTAERWSTGKNQAGDEWFEVDFDAEVTLDRVTLQVFNNDTDDYPRQYAVRVSNTSMNFNATPLVSGAGATGHTVINLPEPATGQFLLIRQTGIIEVGSSWWTIGELLVSCTD